MEKVIVEPAEQRVVVLPDDQPERIGNIYVPRSSSQEKPRMGTVVVTGLGSEDHPMKYRPGQRIMFSQYSGVEITLNLGIGDKEYLVMNQMDIMMTIKKEQ